MAFLRDDKNDRRLEDLYKKEEEDLVKALSVKYDIPTIDLSVISIETDALRLITENIARKLGVAAFKMLEIILGGAFGMDSSDIHIEPEDGKVRIRYRVDGMLEDVLFFDYDTYKLLNSRIKLIAQLKLNVKDNAQDGRFSIKMGGNEI